MIKGFGGVTECLGYVEAEQLRSIPSELNRDLGPLEAQSIEQCETHLPEIHLPVML